VEASEVLPPDALCHERRQKRSMVPFCSGAQGVMNS